MAWMWELALFGLVFCASLPPASSLNPRSQHGFVPESRSNWKRAESCDSSSSKQNAIAYYQSWDSRRDCDSFKPSDIDPTKWTHINFAFADLDESGDVVPSSKEDVELYKEATELKDKNEKLEVWIAVGGHGTGSRPFSRMVSSSSSRSHFIHSAAQFMDKHGFDGIDIDWEYPAATDRGGQKSDSENLVKLIAEMKKEFGDGKGISVTVPAQGYYLKAFNLPEMQSDIDMINFMSYDIHGSWDKPLLAQPATNLTEIDTALQSLLDDGVSAEKINLGLAYYGRSYTLKDHSCTKPGCPASGGGKPGKCSKSKGTLDLTEIQRVMDKEDIDPKLDKDAAVMYFSWDQDQWVSYDNDKTLQMKTDYARDNCLGGSFVWAIDMENPKEKMDPKISAGSPNQLSWRLFTGSLLCVVFFFFV